MICHKAVLTEDTMDGTPCECNCQHEKIDLTKYGFKLVQDPYTVFFERWIRWDENSRLTELKISWSFGISIYGHVDDIEILVQYAKQQRREHEDRANRCR